MMAGVPVPHELLISIRRSFEVAMASRFYHHPALGYCSLYGKKIDPEPGRCRRTDGKKWRCSKDAYPDSKYCERHMHRGRNRSRKPVEAQQPTTLSHSHSHSSSSSALTALTPAAASASSGSFRNFPLHSAVTGASNANAGVRSSQLHLDTASYGMGSRDFRYPYGVKAETDERSFFSGPSASARGLGVDSSLDNTWSLMPSQVSSYSISKENSSSLLQSNYSQLHSVQDIGQVTISSLPKPHQQQQKHLFFGSEFGSCEPVKNESQSLRPFFDEWPKTTRDSWSDLEDDRSNRTSFSTTQLSMSIPMASSDFSTTCSRSPNDD
ncbi:uncharacterized protein A4U43_C04F10090 [Asparagus officinalis]|uniref:Growth-regulating factor n=1 Tax=Asparagus officinalis TaxID=4686 RepID=A0A5P1F0F3_ASPOF|nr:growth-regulating factor 4-like [Asparagus officinalis]XP_020260669.1 growth-regulating factor 4-like [Asparagus officinalis]ONK71574.1 uncharacterized protein A4U43_C04F10090 [Asparagus officinalis]